MASELAVFDEILRADDRVVWILTAHDGPRRGGLVATWINQISLDPDQPQVLAALAPHHYTTELVDLSHCFTLQQISAEQFERLWPFCLTTGREQDKFAGLEITTSPLGSPRLQHCLAWLDCRVFARLETGDRNLYWADVVEGERLSDQAPLTESQMFASASDQQKQKLQENREHDAAWLRPRHESWREALPEELRP